MHVLVAIPDLPCVKVYGGRHNLLVHEVSCRKTPISQDIHEHVRCYGVLAEQVVVCLQLCVAC